MLARACNAVSLIWKLFDCKLREHVSQPATLLVIGSLFLIPCFKLTAQSDLRIRDVSFSKERSVRGGDPWLEATVEVQVRGNSDPAAANPQYLDNVRVYVALAYNLGTRSRSRLEYYWSEVETATLERGTHGFRFYLSPDLIRRNNISSGETLCFSHRSERQLGRRAKSGGGGIGQSARSGPA